MVDRLIEALVFNIPLTLLFSGPDPAYSHSMDAAYPAAREYDSSEVEFMLGAQEAAHSSEIELSDGGKMGV